MLTIGVDPHKQTHSGVAVDPLGVLVAQRTVAARRDGFGQLLEWARKLDGERVWVIEDGGWQFHPDVASTGSGYALAFHAIASVQHHDVPSRSLAAAKAIAYRAIETMCLVSAFGVGLPVQMGVVVQSGAHTLDDEEMDLLRTFVNLWKAREVETLGTTLTQAGMSPGVITTDATDATGPVPPGGPVPPPPPAPAPAP